MSGIRWRPIAVFEADQRKMPGKPGIFATMYEPVLAGDSPKQAESVNAEMLAALADT